MLDILHVAQPTDAGVARCVAALAAAQQRQDLAVAVACPDGGTLRADLDAAGVQVLHWPATRSPGPAVPQEVRALRRILVEHEPALVHLHSAKAGLAGRLALRGRRPTVFSPHAWSFDAATGPLRAASIGWERLAARWTDLFVCVSDDERRHGLRHHVTAPHWTVVPNGVDLDALAAAGPADRQRARARLGLPDVPIAVVVGRLARQKGQDVALAAWPAVRAQVPDARLVLVGDGPDRATLEVRDAPGVHLAGPSHDVASWYHAADLVLVPSRWEGMALTPLEAMACARSVVAADVTGVRESVPEGAGAVIAPDDPQALAEAVLPRLAGRVDADAEGRVGRAHVEAAHDVRVTTARITAAYRLTFGGEDAAVRTTRRPGRTAR